MHDFVIVGAGLYGLTFAHEAAKKGKTSIIFEKRPYIGGNTYCNTIHGIDVHMHGPHIFNTNSDQIWNYVNELTPFNSYRHRVLAYEGTPMEDAPPKKMVYSFPINWLTMQQVFGRMFQSEVAFRTELKLGPKPESPIGMHFEQYCIQMIGVELYHKFYYHYTWKQWGIAPEKIPATVAARIPIRFNANDHYHDTKYSGIPIFDYNALAIALVQGPLVEVETGQDFFNKYGEMLDWKKYGKRLVYSGSIDELYRNCYGSLGYRSLRIEQLMMPIKEYQGIAQVNYVGTENGPTRTIEHRYFNPNNPSNADDKTIVTAEFPRNWNPEEPFERYYPIPTAENHEIYNKYFKLASQETDIIVGGRLGRYRYMNMDQVIASAIRTAANVIK